MGARAHEYEAIMAVEPKRLAVHARDRKPPTGIHANPLQ